MVNTAGKIDLESFLAQIHDFEAFKDDKGRWPSATKNAIYRIFKKCELLEDQVLTVAQWDRLVNSFCHSPNLRDDSTQTDERRAKVALYR